MKCVVALTLLIIFGVFVEQNAGEIRFSSIFFRTQCNLVQIVSAAAGYFPGILTSFCRPCVIYSANDRAC